MCLIVTMFCIQLHALSSGACVQMIYNGRARIDLWPLSRASKQGIAASAALAKPDNPVHR